MIIEVFDRAKLLEQRNCASLANTLHPWDIVGGIALQAAQIGELHRLEAAVALKHLRFLVQHGVLTLLYVGVRQQHTHVIVHQLQGVGVAGEDHRIHLLPGCLAREGANHIIGLVAIFGIDRNVERGQQLLDPIELLVKFLGCFGAASLILGIHIVAEGAPNIERHRHIFGVIFVNCVQYN